MQCTGRDQGLHVGIWRRCHSMLVICPPRQLGPLASFFSCSALRIEITCDLACPSFSEEAKGSPTEIEMTTIADMVVAYNYCPASRSDGMSTSTSTSTRLQLIIKRASQQRGARLCTTHLTSRLCAADWDISCRVSPCHITCGKQAGRLAGWLAGRRAGKATLLEPLFG